MKKRYVFILSTVALFGIALQAAYLDRRPSPEFRDAVVVMMNADRSGGNDEDAAFFRIELAAKTKKDEQILEALRRLRELNAESSASVEDLAKENCTGSCDAWRKAEAAERSRDAERLLILTSVRGDLGMPPL